MIKKLAALLLTLCLLLPLTAWAREPWDCPECGRTGNTGNFCVECGHAAPEPEKPRIWDCPECGAKGITSNYCVNCGHAAPWLTTPEALLQTVQDDASAVRVSTGEYVTFGRYEQDGDTANGPEPVEWLVLDVQDGKVLLLARYGLDAQKYNKRNTDVTWEECSLRTWLNDDFLNAAFTREEQAAIPLTSVDNGSGQGYIGWDTNGGENTMDRVFLLSHREAFESYLSSESDRRTTPTAYAAAQGASQVGDGDYWWWLRSPGSKQSHAEGFRRSQSRLGTSVSNAGGLIRPAIWLDLSSGFSDLESYAP